MSALLQAVSQAVAGHMDKIVACFKPGVKITVLVRTPDFPDRDFCMTDDTYPEIIEMLKRRMIADGGFQG